jgi:hypothetical protein
VPPVTVLDVLDEGADRVAGVAQITIISAIDLLILNAFILKLPAWPRTTGSCGAVSRLFLGPKYRETS